MRVWEQIELVIGQSPRILLAGPPGTGKTRAGMRINLKKDALVMGMTMTDETPMSEVRGHYVAKGGEFVWYDMIFMKAWRESHSRPVRVVINEIDHTGADCSSFMHAFLDDPEIASYNLPTGELLSPGPFGVEVIATMNGKFEDLPEPVLDRFPVRIEVAETHPGAFEGLPTELRKLATGCANDNNEEKRISVRAFKEFATLSTKIDKKVAAQVIFGTRSKEIMNAIQIAAVR